MPATVSESVGALRTQVQSFFAYVRDAANDSAFATDLPFVGEALKDKLGGILPVFDELEAQINAALDLVDPATGNPAAAIADAINGLGLSAISAVANGVSVALNFLAEDSHSVQSDPFALGVGLPGLDLQAQGTANAGIGYKLDLTLAFDTDLLELTTVDTAGDELEIGLKVGLDVAGSGAMGFLNLKIDDELDADELQINFGLNLAGGKKVQQLTVADVTPLIDAIAQVRLALEMDSGSDLLPTVYADFVSSYSVVDYDPTMGLGALGGTASLAFEDIELDLGGLVDMIAKTYRPITERVFGPDARLGDLLDTITTPIPIIDDGLRLLKLTDVFDLVGDDDIINLLDLAAAAAKIAGSGEAVIDAFAKAVTVLRAVEDLKLSGDNVARIPLGDVTLIGDAPSMLVNAMGKGNVGSLDAGAPVTGFTPADNPLQKAKDELGMDPNLQNPPASQPGLGGLLEPLSKLLDQAGLSVPILKDPSLILPIIFNGFGGDPVTLVEYDVPKLAFSAPFSQFFPIIGPLGVGFEGNFGGGIDIDFGYDTRGLAEGSFEKGFYFATKAQTPVVIDGQTIYFEPAGFVNAGIGAYAGVNIGFAAATIGGGATAELGAYFEGATTQGDGKLYLDQFGDCIFDPVAGQFGVNVFATIRIGFGAFGFSRRFEIADVTLADFSFGCPPPTTDPDMGLATLLNVDMVLNAGDRATLRSINGQVGADVSEKFEVRNARDENGVLIAGALEVGAFTLREQYGAAETIRANMGAQRDIVVIAADVTQAATLNGNGGDDLLVGGAGNDVLGGQEGSDRLIGGKGNDKLFGLADDDYLEGGEGADIIEGGAGFDQVTFENSAVGVEFKFTQIGNRVGFVGKGGEAEGDVMFDVEYIIGSRKTDVIFGNPNQGNVLEGLAGDDALIGGGSDDLILGGHGADALLGGAGVDSTSYVTSGGQVTVDLLLGYGMGGEAEGDTYLSIENVQGSFGDDVLIGGTAANELDGWIGDDIIVGNGGADVLRGGDGNDTIRGGGDGDTIDGGGSINAPARDLLTYAHRNAGVVVDLLGLGGGSDTVTRAKLDNGDDLDGYSTIEDVDGSNFIDQIVGDKQYNTIRGLGGADSIDGQGGNDIIIGGAGADAMIGGTGIDLADYRDSNGAVIVNLTTGLGFGAHAEGDTLATFENLRGSEFVDVLIGDVGDNLIDPGLARSTAPEVVDGRAGFDTLIIDYSRGDTSAEGLIGGFNQGSTIAGQFRRANPADAAQADGVNFANIERLKVTGTVRDDTIYGGAGDDLIATGKGNDFIATGFGADRVFAGSGNDVVAAGTDANRNLSDLAGGSQPFHLDGGAGIDALSISLAAATYDVRLSGGDGTTEFEGVNASLASGAAIERFEVLRDVVTGFGDDRITQLGVFDNQFSTRFGVDGVRPGLGKDRVDLGIEFRVGEEVILTGTGTTIEAAAGKSRTDLLGNDGDLLMLDYSGQSSAVTSSIGVVNSGYFIADLTGGFTALQTNAGDYTAGPENTVLLTNVERINVLGSAFDDILIGTQLLFGRNEQTFGAVGGTFYRASTSARGDDIISGGAGNDLIAGNSGDDRLLGDDGNDALFGAHLATNATQLRDLGEVDTLTGGAGADIFVIAGVDGTLYNDFSTRETGLNRAIITDFAKAEDKLFLYGQSSDYYTEAFGDGVRIFLNDSSNADELVAEIQNVDGFELDAAYVQYVGGSNAAGDPLMARLIAAEGSGAASALAGTPMLQSTALAPVARSSSSSLAAPVPNAVPMGWVTQTNDATALKAALFGSAFSPLAGGTLTVEGAAEAFGTFQNDPLGLGSGIVLSTGDVDRIDEANQEDGGVSIGQTVNRPFELVGSFGNANIYRADLSGLDVDLSSLRLTDKSGGFAGAGGIASGFDIDAVVLSSKKFATLAELPNPNGPSSIQGLDLNDPTVLPQLNAFAFDAAGTMFLPGTQRPADGFPNAAELVGEVNGMPDFSKATLGTFDGTLAATGYLSLGDGGELGFDLRQPVDTSGPLYLYVAEVGGQGEQLSAGLAASTSRLESPSDLSTDLGQPGIADDVVSLTYKFTPQRTNGSVDGDVTGVKFDFVFFSEELVEYANSQFNDTLKITLNGVNLARLSDGSFVTVNTLYAPPAGPDGPTPTEMIYNPVGAGPTAGSFRADGYSKTLSFTGVINAGVENVLKVEVRDVRDGLLDSGVLVRGSSFETITGIGGVLPDGTRPVGTTRLRTADFYVERSAAPLLEGEAREIDYGLLLPAVQPPAGTVQVTFDPSSGLDLGAGAGNAITRAITAPGDLDSLFSVVALQDGLNNGPRFETIQLSFGGDIALAGQAPLIIQVNDAPITVTRTIGDAPDRYSRTDPNAWENAWSDRTVVATHTANVNATSPVYSAVNFGTTNPGVLSGSDMLNGDLGVSGRAGLNTAQPQEIGGTEALRFTFLEQDVLGVSLDFARFEAGDVARVRLYDSRGTLLRDVTSSTAELDISGVSGVASLVLNAQAGAFMLDSLTFTEIGNGPSISQVAELKILDLEPVYTRMGSLHVLDAQNVMIA